MKQMERKVIDLEIGPVKGSYRVISVPSLMFCRYTSANQFFIVKRHYVYTGYTAFQIYLHTQYTMPYE